MKKLIDSQPHQIQKIIVDATQSEPHTLGENRIERIALAQRAVHELAQPSPVACVEASGSVLERGVEHRTAPNVGQDSRRDDARAGDAADRRNL